MHHIFRAHDNGHWHGELPSRFRQPGIAPGQGFAHRDIAVQRLMGIARHKDLLLFLALQDKTRRQLVGDLLPGIVRQAPLAHPCHGLLARLRCRLVHLRIAWLLASIDVANQRGFGHLRVFGRKSRRGGPPHGVSGDIGLFDPEMLEQGMHVAHQMIERVVRFARRRRGHAMSASVVGNDLVAFGKQWKLVFPQVDTGAIAMRQDQWEPLAVDFVVQVDIVYMDNGHRSRLLVE